MRTFKQVAVLLGATVAVGALAPTANAQTTPWGPAVPFAGGSTLAGATFTGVSVGGGTGDFTYASPASNTYTANLNFNPGFNTGIGSTQTFSYTLATTNGNVWTQASLTSQMQALLQGGSFSKEVCSTGFGTGTCQTYTSTDTGTSAQSPTLVGFGTQIWVRDTYVSTVASPSGQVTGITNTFMSAPVPGPLPVLGAGAAFGFSRKLRRRIKASA